VNANDDRHWTVTILVAEVVPPQPIKESNGYSAKVNLGVGTTAVAMTPRQVTERFSSTVRADSEAEAYRKAAALLEVNRPEPELVERFPARPIRDNPQA
jgi:hypothetical protein